MIDILNKLSRIIAPVFYKILFLSIIGAIIGIIVLVIRKAFDKKISPLWKYVMWIMVVVALVVPFRFKSNMSLTENISNIENISFREEYDNIKYKESVYNQSMNIDPKKSEQIEYQKKSLFYKSLIFDVAIPLIWFFGVILSFLFLFANKFYLSRKIKINTITTNVFDSVLNECKIKLSIRSDIETIHQNYINSPALFGFFKPKILLPKYIDTIGKDSVYYIILHELAHYKRKDMLVNYILLLIQTFHWFNPVIWYLFKKIREDMEVLNDSYVIKTIGNKESKAYSKSLVEVLGFSHNVSLMPKLICMTDGKKNVERRISMIKLNDNFKKHKLIISVFCIAVIIVIGGLFLTQKSDVKDTVKTLFENRTESISNKKQIENIFSHLQYPQNIQYNDVNGYTDDNLIGLTINIKINADDYNETENQLELKKIAFTVFSLVGDVSQINFTDIKHPDIYLCSFSRNEANKYLGYDCFERTELYDSFKFVIDDINKLNDTDKHTTDKTLSALTFPAYDSDNVNMENMINFNVVASFPSEWEFKVSNNNEKAIPMGEFLTPAYIYNDNKLLGYIGFNTFEPYTEEISKEDYYKTVYTNLRMSNFFHWDPYKSIVSDDVSETGIADIYYLDEEELEKNHGDIASVPSYETKGILSYNKDLKVYIGIAFMPNTLTDKEITELAKSVSIQTEMPNSDYTEFDKLQTYVSEEDKTNLYNLMKTTVEQYKNGEIKPDERFAEFPNDFVFSENWGKDELDITRREVMGDYRVVLQSSDSKYSMVMIANNFKYVDSNGVTGGDMVIDAVVFDKNNEKIQ